MGRHLSKNVVPFKVTVWSGNSSCADDAPEYVQNLLLCEEGESDDTTLEKI